MLIKTVTFEDNGQDFLEFDLDEDGIVIDCRPFQAFLWVNHKVINHDSLVANQNVILQTTNGDLTIKHKIESIRERKTW